MTKRQIIEGLIAVAITLFACYLLTGLVATAAGYPMW
jgi:hypothetical protein